MRIGIISDIHANFAALSAVRAFLRRTLKVKTVWCLGDVLGYGPRPPHTWALLEQMRPEVWLAGNHDWYVAPTDVDDLESPSLLPMGLYSSTVDEHVGGPRKTAAIICMRHREVLSRETLEALKTLPTYDFPRDNILAVHSIFVPGAEPKVLLEERAKTHMKMEEIFSHSEAPWHRAATNQPFLKLGGHTHIMGLWSRPLDKKDWHVLDEHILQLEQPYLLAAGHFHYINPGSVGFPRGDCFHCPTLAVLDTEDWTVTFYSTPYDSQAVRADMEEIKYPPDAWSERQLKPCQET